MTRKEQEDARTKWMVAEAERLIEARARIVRPAKPVTVEAKTDPEQVMRDATARQVVEALARRDRGLG